MSLDFAVEVNSSTSSISLIVPLNCTTDPVFSLFSAREEWEMSTISCCSDSWSRLGLSSWGRTWERACLNSSRGDFLGSVVCWSWDIVELIVAGKFCIIGCIPGWIWLFCFVYKKLRNWGINRIE